MAPGPAALSRRGRRCLGRRFYLMGGAASRRQGGGDDRPGRRELSRREKGFAGAAGGDPARRALRDQRGGLPTLSTESPVAGDLPAVESRPAARERCCAFRRARFCRSASASRSTRAGFFCG